MSGLTAAYGYRQLWCVTEKKTGQKQAETGQKQKKTEQKQEKQGRIKDIFESTSMLPFSVFTFCIRNIYRGKHVSNLNTSGRPN